MTDTGSFDKYHVKWDNDFVGAISIDTRGGFPRKNHVSITKQNGISHTSVHVQIFFSYKLL